MWLLVLLFVKCNNFILEPGILHSYSLVTRWLLVGYSFKQLFMRYPIIEETDLDKSPAVLLERIYFLLHLWGIWQILIGLLFHTEPCISIVNM